MFENLATKFRNFIRLSWNDKLKKFLFLFKKFILNKIFLNLPLPKKIGFGGWFLCYPNEVGDSIFAGMYEQAEVDLLPYFINKGDIVFDIGAHEGFYTVIFSKLVGEKGRVVSFEPSPREFKRLQRNIHLNKLNNVTTEKKAVYDSIGRAKFYIAQHKTGLNSLFQLKEDKSYEIEVDTINLDSYFYENLLGEKINFVKIDAEGAELKILEGADQILSNVRPIFLIEISSKRNNLSNYPQKVISVLDKYNYRIYSIKDRFLVELEEKEFYDENCFCIPEEKINQFSFLIKPSPGFITFVTVPKKFEGEFNFIQKNALKSWLLLKPQPEIIIFNPDNSLIDTDFNKDIKIINDIKTNKYGTPLVNDIFEKAQKIASHDIICYINTDIILTQDFIENIILIMREIKKRFIENFLIIGRRTDVRIDSFLDFGEGWEQKLTLRAKQHGKLLLSGIDYFIFPRYLYKNIPAFNLGRGEWDNWLVWDALRRGVFVVDATPSITAIHQSHSYRHHPFGEEKAGRGPEELENQFYAREVPHRYQIFDANYKFINGKLKVNLVGKFKIKSLFYRFLDRTRIYREKIFLTKSSLGKLKNKLKFFKKVL